MTRSVSPIRLLIDQDLSVDEIVALAGAGAGQRASLYLPTHAAGRDVAQDPIRFRGLIRRATEEIDDPAMLDAVRELADDPEFWAHNSSGLGVLAGVGRDRSGSACPSPGQPFSRRIRWGPVTARPARASARRVPDHPVSRQG